jgi:O-antigen/teichoic acid export membrane protein
MRREQAHLADRPAAVAASVTTTLGVREFTGPDALSAPDTGPAVVRGAALRVGSFGGSALCSVGAAALLFRYLGVVQTGQYAIAMSLSAVATGLTDLGLTVVGMRELTLRHGEQRARIARNLLGMRIAVSGAGVLAISLFAFAAYGGLLGLGVLIAGGGVLIQNIQAILAVPLSVRLRLGWVSALEFLRQFAIAGTIALLVLAGAHLLAFLAATAIAALITLPPTIALVRGDIPLRPAFDSRQWRALAGPMFVYSVAVITATLYLRVAIVLVSLLDGGHQLGYFSVSFRVVESLFVLPGLLVGSAFPILVHAAHNDPVRLGHVLARMFDASLIAGVWISVSLAVGAPLAIEVIGGPSFGPAAPVLAVQGLAVAAVFVSNVWLCALLSMRMHRAILALNLSLLALVAVTTTILASLDGAMGAAIATASVEVVAAIASATLVMRGRAYLRPSFRVLPKVGLAASIAAAPMLLTDAPIMGRIVLSTCLYAGVLLSLKAFPSDLRELLFTARRTS